MARKPKWQELDVVSLCRAPRRRGAVHGRFERLGWRSGLEKSMELSERMLVEGHYLHGAVSWEW